MKTYKSEISLGMALPIILTLGSVTLFFMIKGQWIPLVFILLLVAFVVHMFATTYYVLKDGELKLYCGVLYRKTLSVNSILRIEESNNLSNGPATSFRRLEIFYNGSDSVLVSPVNRKQFVQDLLHVNPVITVKGEI